MPVEGSIYTPLENGGNMYQALFQEWNRQRRPGQFQYGSFHWGAYNRGEKFIALSRVDGMERAYGSMSTSGPGAPGIRESRQIGAGDFTEGPDIIEESDG